MNLFDLLFPKFCVGCNKLGSYLCLNCRKNILQTDLVCPTCEKPAIGGKVHPLCHKKFGLDGLWSLGVYKDPLRKIIQKLKYKFVKEAGDDLINLIIEYIALSRPIFIDEIKKDRGADWIVLPVPLHPAREKWRGFNQSALLAKSFAVKIGLDYAEALKRIKHTKPQVEFKAWQRKQNIRGAFSLDSRLLPARHRQAQSLAGGPLATSYLLVDDVWTTGSTLKECCKVLKQGGAKKVWALTLAR